MNKSAFRKLSYGVYLISSLDGDRPTGCIANSAMQITSDPASMPSASTMTTLPIPALKEPENLLFPSFLKTRILGSSGPLDSSQEKTSINLILFPIRLLKASQ